MEAKKIENVIEKIKETGNKKEEETTTTIQITFFAEEIKAISKKTGREIPDKESLHDAINDIISEVVKEESKPLEINAYMRSLSDTKLINLTREAGEFLQTGILPEKAIIKDIMAAFNLSARDIEKKVLEEATNRFSSLVSILFKASPGTFLK